MLYLVAALKIFKAGRRTKFNDHLARAVDMRPTSYRIIVTSIFTSLRFRGKSKVALFVREKKKVWRQIRDEVGDCDNSAFAFIVVF